MSRSSVREPPSGIGLGGSGLPARAEAAHDRLALGLGRLRKQPVERTGDRLQAQHHPGAAAERRPVGTLAGPNPSHQSRWQRTRNEARLDGPPDDREAHERREDFRKERDHVAREHQEKNVPASRGFAPGAFRSPATPRWGRGARASRLRARRARFYRIAHNERRAGRSRVSVEQARCRARGPVAGRCSRRLRSQRWSAFRVTLPR